MRLLKPFRINSVRISALAVFNKHSLPRWFVFLFDAAAIFVTFLFAYVLRFNFDQSEIDFNLALRQSLIVLSVYCGFELIFKPFAGLIRHTTIRDIFNVALTATTSVMVLIFLTLFSRIRGWNNMLNVPYSVLLIHFVSINVMLFVTRIVIKMIYELVTTEPVVKSNVVIFGAGSMGVLVKNVIQSDNSNKYHIVAFLDNNKKLQHKNLSGIPVFGPKKLKKDFLRKNNISTIIFAIVNIPPAERSEIYKFAVDQGLEVLEVPPVHRWLNGEFGLNQLQRIKVDDLLSREPIELNMKIIERGLTGKSILVTGAAGSIGSEIVRQLARFYVKKLILVDNAETPMFNLENELQERFSYVSFKTILGDVTDPIRMVRVFKDNMPDIVFHAAAYKHVPLMEDNPHEAIRVNVGSTILLTDLAVTYGVQKFVMISTDKAVNPTNVMGASKRMCELILKSYYSSANIRTGFLITRFGNVLGSNGSVIPIFKRQIERGGPLTVTHPEITRYFMTIPEACQLVLEAGFMGRGGEIFEFEMGEPVKIADLARRMIKLSGFEPDSDIGIEYIGLRPGEKLYEELLTHKEKTRATYNPKVKILEEEFNDDGIFASIEALMKDYQDLAETALINRIIKILPEFRPNNKRYLQAIGKENDIGIESYHD